MQRGMRDVQNLCVLLELNLQQKQEAGETEGLTKLKEQEEEMLGC